MIRRVLSVLLRLGAWSVFLAAFVWPTISLMHRCWTNEASAAAGLTPTWRQWELLGRSAGLSAIAAASAIVLALPLAAMLACGGRAIRRSALAAALFLILLTPPMLYSFGWDRLAPNLVPPSIRCIVLWALWACPIPAMLLAGGWSRGGRQAYEAALLSSSSTRALVVGTRPVLQRHVVLSFVVLFLLFLGDYGVPHACGLVVYATELLGWASSSTLPMDTVLPSLPNVLATAVLLLLATWLWQDELLSEADDFTPPSANRRWAVAASLLVFLVGWIAPIGGLALRLGSWNVVRETARTYSPDILWSVGTAILAGVLSVGMAWGLLARPWVRRVATGWALLFGAVPGALIGTALLAGFNHAATGWIFDHWPILTLCYVARFGWIAMLAASALPWSRSDICDQAYVDGADRRRIIDSLLAPMHAPVGLAVVAVITALSLAELPASSLVRVPAFNPVAHVIIEKFHRFEYGMLAALSSCFLIAAGPAVALLVTVHQKKIR